VIGLAVVRTLFVIDWQELWFICGRGVQFICDNAGNGVWPFLMRSVTYVPSELSQLSLPSIYPKIISRQSNCKLHSCQNT